MRLRVAGVILLLIAAFTACSGNRSSGVLPSASINETPLSAQKLAPLAGPACTVSKSFPASFFEGYTLGALSTNDAWVAALDDTLHLVFLHYSAGTVSTTTPGGPQFNFAFSIVPLSDTDVWFAGDAYTIGGYLLHYDGHAWSRIAFAPGLDPSSTFVESIAARASNDVWFAGDTQGAKFPQFVLQHWDGHSMKLVATGPWAINGGVPGILEFSPTNVWVLVNGLVRNSIGVEVVRWNGSHLMYTILPLLPGQSALASTGAQMDATSPTDVWVVGNGSVPGSTASTLQIWHYNGTWQPYLYRPVENTIFGESVVAFRPNDAVIGGINVTLPQYQALTFVYNGMTRWHLESNNLPEIPVGQASHVPGTSSFWTLLGSPNGSSSDAVLVTCS